MEAASTPAGTPDPSAAPAPAPDPAATAAPAPDPAAAAPAPAPTPAPAAATADGSSPLDEFLRSLSRLADKATELLDLVLQQEQQES